MAEEVTHFFFLCWKHMRTLPGGGMGQRLGVAGWMLLGVRTMSAPTETKLRTRKRWWGRKREGGREVSAE